VYHNVLCIHAISFKVNNEHDKVALRVQRNGFAFNPPTTRRSLTYRNKHLNGCDTRVAYSIITADKIDFLCSTTIYLKTAKRCQKKKEGESTKNASLESFVFRMCKAKLLGLGIKNELKANFSRIYGSTFFFCALASCATNGT
jgi:hypothetical protein